MELIMVIAIIVVLAAIAIPKFTDVNNSAKNSADEYTIRRLKATVSLLYLKSQADDAAAWPTGSEIDAQVPNMEITTTSFEANKWRYDDTGNAVIFYCRHGSAGSATGRRWWTYYRADVDGYIAGNFVEGAASADH